MKLVVFQENLIKALTHASRSVASRPQLPVLSHLLLKTDQGRLQISATNLEIGLNLWLGAKIEKEGALTLPARLFTEFVASLPTASLDLTASESRLSVVCGSHRADFAGLAASEFPAVPVAKKKPHLNLTLDQLNFLAVQVVFASATDDSRPVLTGLLLRPVKGHLQAVATDGYRLSIKDLGPAAISLPAKGLLLPSRSVLEVTKIFTGQGDQKIGLFLDSNQLIFAGDEAEVVSRLLEGDFPDFEKIIPSSAATTITFDRQEMLRSVRLSSIFARDAANIIKCKVSRHGGIKISANAQQVGKSESTMAVKMTGEENQIAFNSHYLLDFLNSTDKEEISLEMTTPLAPGVFRPVGDASYFHLIMPVRVQE
ncbi:MAG: DNA polymerase III subunit beta [Candidatus Shapirobacteria bacterium]